MSPATWPRDNPLEERLLHVDPRLGRLRDGRIADLPALLQPGDLLVVNDGATLPASLRGATEGGAPVEVRLIGELADEGRYAALLFGAGDWRTRTEDRPAPPALGPGDVVRFGDDLSAAVERVSAASPRLVEIAFRERGASLWSALYRRGRPIQYAYVAAPLEIWHAQTRYASRPLCAELPSAGRPLVWSLLLDLIRRGVRVASLTHAAGISSTGDPALDALLPLPERFDIPEETVSAVREAKAAGRRVVAVGTTVTRALEGCAAQHGGELRAGPGVTDLVLRPGFRPRVVDGLLTGVHDPTESHFRLLEAFAPAELLHRANAHAEQAGYLCHEFGDSYLVLS
ncbi:S-adenosylmethionine:tRNA ribosyltransferase-isomerase [Sorangium sp. So ce131]|uniref:S-adenosylmethionine:tRNA ribosyltransferase-isomerase n=1 Tax=Sorangium sp. So ce131 TaxID=3133282 RepID=UPI003F604D77